MKMTRLVGGALRGTLNGGTALWKATPWLLAVAAASAYYRPDQMIAEWGAPHWARFQEAANGNMGYICATMAGLFALRILKGGYDAKRAVSRTFAQHQENRADRALLSAARNESTVVAFKQLLDGVGKATCRNQETVNLYNRMHAEAGEYRSGRRQQMDQEAVLERRIAWLDSFGREMEAYADDFKRLAVDAEGELLGNLTELQSYARRRMVGLRQSREAADRILSDVRLGRDKTTEIANAFSKCGINLA